MWLIINYQLHIINYQLRIAASVVADSKSAAKKGDKTTKGKTKGPSQQDAEVSSVIADCLI